MRELHHGDRRDHAPLRATWPSLPVHLPRRRAAVGAGDRRRHPRPAHLLLRGLAQRLPADPRDHPGADRGGDHRHPASRSAAGAHDRRLDRRRARPGGDRAGLGGGGQHPAASGQARPAGPGGRDRGPLLHRRGRDPRPHRLVADPAVRRLRGLDRLRDGAPLPRGRGRDAAGARRHQLLSEPAQVGRLLGAAAAHQAARLAAADQPDHRAGRRRAHLRRGRRSEPRARRADRAAGRDHDLARAHGDALEVDPAARARPRARGRRPARGSL